MAWKARGTTTGRSSGFNQVIKMDPNSVPAYGQRAEAYEAKGDTGRAESDRKEADRIIARLRRQ